jgi:hypothetical protein
MAGYNVSLASVTDAKRDSLRDRGAFDDGNGLTGLCVAFLRSCYGSRGAG